MPKTARKLILVLLLSWVSVSYVEGFAFLYFVSPSSAYRFQSPGNIPYRISSSFLGGNSGNIQAVRNAFSTWDASNTSLNFSEVGSGEKVYVYSQNQGGGGVLAYTQPYISGKTIYYCNVNFNSYYKWSTNPSSGQYDIQRVATHEFGHVIGLDHPNQADDSGKNYNCSFQTVNATGQEVMNSSVSSGLQSHSLTQDEVCARDYLYPYNSDTTAPATIGDLSWSKASSTSIDMYWTAPGDDGYSGTASSYDIRWSNSPINSSNFSSATPLSGTPSPAAGGTVQHLTVSGFDNSLIYYFAIKATDDHSNTSGMSNVITVDLISPSAVTNLTASNPGISSIKLQWTATGDDAGSGTASSYDLRYSTSTLTSSNFSFATQVTGLSSPQAAGATETFTVTGLAQGTTYYFALKVSDEVPNTSGISNGASLATQKDSDGDGLSDLDEVNIYGTDPYDADTDDDTYNDGIEVGAGTNPLNAQSFPAVMTITGDNNYTLYVNGNQIGSDGNWTTAETYYVNLQSGGNVAIQATDAGGIASIACQIRYGSQLQFSNFIWQVSTSASSGWQSSSYDHSTWSSATEHDPMGQGPWGTTVSSAFDPKTQWIWSSDAYNHDQVFFWTEFNTTHNAVVKITADNAFDVYQNGTPMGSGSDWPSAKFIPTTLGVGDVIAVDAVDQGGIAAVMGEIVMQDSAGNKKSFVTDSSWKLSTSHVSGWQNTSFDDSGWSGSTEEASLGAGPWGYGNNLSNISGSAKWIWASDAYGVNEVYLRKTISNSSMTFTADNACEVYLNGVLVKSGSDWSNPPSVGFNLQNGDVIAVKAWDLGGMAGFLAAIDYNGTQIVSNTTWKVSKGSFSDLSWAQKAYDDSAWMNAISRGSNGISPWGSLSSISTSSQWIWSADFEKDDAAYFRFRMGDSNTETGVTTLQFCADNGLEFYLNGTLLLTANDWTHPASLSLRLASGDILAFGGSDSGYKAGFLLRATGAYTFVSDSSWKVSTSASSGWNNKGFNDSSWTWATSYGNYGVAPWETGVSDFPYPSSAQWIWTVNNVTGSSNIDSQVYFRKEIS
ncbi:MAG: fibronectin type III domain-containing protein [Chlamydiae bacterium]|nr:fibronectin type III domain-containing protein [Chlamydiota bacterium]